METRRETQEAVINELSMALENLLEYVERANEYYLSKGMGMEGVGPRCDSISVGGMARRALSIAKDFDLIAHTNSNGDIYYSKVINGETVYSFTRDFEDTWDQQTQDLYGTDLEGGAG